MIEQVLVMPRPLALQLLHEVQTAGRQVEGLVAARTQPDHYYLGRWQDQLSRVDGDRRQPWAVFLYRPDAPEEPSAADFIEHPELLRLTASLATKGVMQLRAWRCSGGCVEERELRIEG